MPYADSLYFCLVKITLKTDAPDEIERGKHKTMNHKYLVILLSIIAVFSSCKKDPSNPSITVNTKPITEITSISAISGGDISTEGELRIDMGGVCWSTSKHPTTNDFYTTDIENNTGSFVSQMTQLSANTTYYVRAYAKIGSNINYGNERTFTTLSEGGGNGGGNGNNEGSVSVSTKSVTDITTTSAVCGGSVTVSGNATVTGRGVCWSTSHNPTIAQDHTTDGQGDGSFTSNITGLSAGTKYYVRGYAQYASETVYGEEKDFTTEELPQLPSVTITLINVTPTYLELKFEPSSNISYYCYNIGSTLTSTIHHTGVNTRKFTSYQSKGLQPDTEYEFSIVAYDNDGTAVEIMHPRFKTNPAPYVNYLRVYDNFYELNYAKLLNTSSGNANLRFKEIQIWSEPGYWLRFLTVVYWNETDNIWSSGTYTTTLGGVNSIGQYNCMVYKNGSQVGVSEGSKFTISKNGNIYTYDLYSDDGYITAHFVGIPTQ